MENLELKIQSIIDNIDNGLGRKTADEFNPSENNFNEISNAVNVAFNAKQELETLLVEIKNQTNESKK